MQSNDLFCRLKRFKLLEPSVTLFSFVLMSVLVVSCFFYLDYEGFGGAAKEMLRLPGTPERLVRVESREKRAEGGDRSRGRGRGRGRGGKCDWFDGEWVRDKSYPLYEEKDCKFLDQGFKCGENGRPDRLYTKWRWQPRNCNLPR